MLNQINCIICNHIAQMSVSNLEGYQKGHFFQIYNCKNCDTSFALPHETNEKIYDNIYSNVDIVPGYNRYAQYAKEISNQRNPLKYLANQEGAYFAIKKILEKNPLSSKILEVGSGLGYLTYAIRQKGYDILGLDISSDAVANAKKIFGDYYICQDVYDYAKNNSNKYDIIILTEVIEHIADPITFCEALISLLTPKGRLIITTPNKSAFSREEKWETELPPVHLTWFSETSFKILCQQKHWDVSFFDFTYFNKKHIDVTRFIWYDKFYRIKNRESVIGVNGEIIKPVIIDNNHSFLKYLKKIFKPLFIYFLTHKHNMNRNNVLCVIIDLK